MTPEELNRINAVHYAKLQAAEEQRVAEKLERAAKLVAAGLGADPAFQADVDVEAALLSEAKAQVDADARELAAARAVLDKMDMERQALDEVRGEYDWKPHAIRFAERIRRERPDLLVHELAHAVELVLVDNGIYGRGGKAVTAATIKRELLRSDGFKTS